MIFHSRRAPVVTCPHCEAPFKITKKVIEEAIDHDGFCAPVPASESMEPGPSKYLCPHCGRRSTQIELAGDDVEMFDATADPEAKTDLSP